MPTNSYTPVLIAIAGLLGAAGVALAAAAAHVAAGDPVRAAAEIAMVHAAAVIGIVAYAFHSRSGAVWRWIAAAMLSGAALFSTTVGLGALIDFRPLPMLAPIGGSLTVIAWTAVAIAGFIEAMRPGTR
ncbi:MAG: hypothetical protein APF80_08570 [Alphaproteobacteria bacterium BRH_c36]|nr:MAG: hypothetical protein APF80_08570 [Alphaproteobacteria bacterium BRH_c36]